MPEKLVRSFAYRYYFIKKMERQNLEHAFYNTLYYCLRHEDDFVMEFPEHRKQSGPQENLKLIVSNTESQKYVLNEMMLRVEADSFLTFLVDLLALIAKVRPELILNKQNVPFEVILKFKSIDELKDSYVSNEIGKMSYRGWKDLRAELEKKGLDFNMKLEEEEVIKRGFDRRNEVVHRDGVYRVLSEKGDPESRISFDGLPEYINIFESTADRIDAEACKKFDFLAKGLAVDPARQETGDDV